MTGMKTTTRTRRSAKRYTKADPIPPVEDIAERVRWLRETLPPPGGRRFRNEAGFIQERQHHNLFTHTVEFGAEGVTVGGWQVYEKDADGKDVPSTFRFDITKSQMDRLRAYAYGNEYVTIEERMARGRMQAKTKGRAKAGGRIDLQAAKFGRMLALAEDDPELQTLMVNAWANREGMPAEAPPLKVDEGDKVEDLPRGA